MAAGRVVTETTWLALGAFATLWTLVWMLVEDRITASAGIAAAAWLVFALLGGNVYRVTTSGSQLAAGAPALEYLGWALAALSFLALFLNLWGVYPPENPDTIADTTNE